VLQATGYKRPYLGFLPTRKLFRGDKTPAQFAPPNLFLQHFVANDWSCLMTNAGYYEGLGTVGHNHIGNSSFDHSSEGSEETKTKRRYSYTHGCYFPLHFCRYFGQNDDDVHVG
jgi:hypothetical protein